MVSCVGDADAAAIGWEHASAAFHPVRNSTVQWHRVACSVATVQTDSSWQLLMHARARARRTRTQGTAQSTDSVLPLAPEPERPTAGASSFSLEFGRRGSTPRWFPLPFIQAFASCTMRRSMRLSQFKCGCRVGQLTRRSRDGRWRRAPLRYCGERPRQRPLSAVGDGADKLRRGGRRGGRYSIGITISLPS